MGEEANKHGFVITSQRALLATRPLAYFERTKNGIAQMFEITEYKIFPGRIFLRGAGDEITLEYHDENGFEECISAFNDYMIKEGYTFLDKALEIKEFAHEDGIYVKRNYPNLSKLFMEENQVGKLDDLLWSDFLDIVGDYVKSLYDLEWEKAKPQIMKAAGFIVEVLINKANASIEEDDDQYTYFNLQKYTNGIRTIISPLKIVYISYKYKDAENVLISFLKDFVG